jgi:hypothetical protein
VLAVFMTVLSNALVNKAEESVSSGLVAIGVAAMPLWAGLFSALARATTPAAASGWACWSVSPAWSGSTSAAK